MKRTAMKRTAWIRRSTTKLRRSAAMPERTHSIRTRSLKTVKRDRKYAKERLIYLAAHARCEAQWDEGCLVVSSLVHHRAGRIGEAMLDQSTWLASCNYCHLALHASPARAYELGLMTRRVT